MINYICQEKINFCQNFVKNHFKSTSKYHRVKFMKEFHVRTFLAILTIRKAITLTNVIFMDICRNICLDLDFIFIEFPYNIETN